MTEIEIVIDNKAYPCRQTMGAMLRFKAETGKEVTEISNSLSDMCTYLFCCVVSACKKDGVDFNMNLMEFADSITPDDLTKWTDTVNATADPSPEDTETQGEKKS